MRRQRRTKEQWQSILAAQQSSGLAPPEYCVKHNIHLQTFYARRCEMSKRAPQQTGKLIKIVKPKTQSVSMMSELTKGKWTHTLQLRHALANRTEPASSEYRATAAMEC